MRSDYPKMLKMLDELHDEGTLSRPDYKMLRWQLFKCMKQAGFTQVSSLAQSKPEEVRDSTGKTYCKIPAETFMMGPEDVFEETKAPIYMAKFPITAKDFMTFVEQGNYPYPAEDFAMMRHYSPHDYCPACNISWMDAKAYCRWLRAKTGEYYSLPSEAEWELAARGADGRMYPWGNQPLRDDLACYQGDYAHKSAVSVGNYDRNVSPYGCMDMVGNIWEFCLDTFDDDPRDPRVLRGGSWGTPPDQVNCYTKTICYPPEQRVVLAGFRVIYMNEEMLDAYRIAYAQTLPDDVDVLVEADETPDIPYTPYDPADQQYQAAHTIRFRKPTVDHVRLTKTVRNIRIDLQGDQS